MAAAVGRLLSFSKNAKLFVSPLRLSASSVSHYSVETSKTGEVITHTGQVRFNLSVFQYFIFLRPEVSLASHYLAYFSDFGYLLI